MSGTATLPVGSGLAVGLFGKLPAHGDFVDRGWPEATVAAIDDWLSAGLADARITRGDAVFAAWMHAAPMWEGYVPAGLLGPLALRIAIAPSVDRAGRLFAIVAGVAGDDAAVWAYDGAAGHVAEAVYDAVAGRLDADAMLAQLTDTSGEVRDDTPPPTDAIWWPTSVVPDEECPPPVRTGAVDAALLERLMGAGQG